MPKKTPTRYTITDDDMWDTLHHLEHTSNYLSRVLDESSGTDRPTANHLCNVLEARVALLRYLT